MYLLSIITTSNPEREEVRSAVWGAWANAAKRKMKSQCFTSSSPTPDGKGGGQLSTASLSRPPRKKLGASPHLLRQLALAGPAVIPVRLRVRRRRESSFQSARPRAIAQEPIVPQQMFPCAFHVADVAFKRSCGRKYGVLGISYVLLVRYYEATYDNGNQNDFQGKSE